MIPIRLELRNFMSYGENVTPLDLRGIHVACLTGDNGHGKSALLDAITWALWGEARASSDELIRLGADDMRVVFDFQLGDQLYRVIRGRTKRTAGNVWELYVADAGQANHPSQDSSLSWRPISGQGVRDTGRAIERLLRMDYRTFINSAYIQQGKADEFTKQSVTDRKKILADILDLSRYEILEQKAKERRNEADSRVQELEAKIADIDTELANEERYKAELAAKKSEQARLRTEIEQLEARQRELESRKAELDGIAQRLHEIEIRVSQWQSEIEDLLAKREIQEKRVARYKAVIADKDRITTGLRRLSEVRNNISEMDRSLEMHRQLDLERRKILTSIEGECHKLNVELGSCLKEITALDEIIAQIPAAQSQAECLKTKLSSYDQAEKRRAAIYSEISALSAQLGELKVVRDGLDEAKKELEEKLTLLSKPGAQCPVCKTELGKDKHQAIMADYKRQLEETLQGITTVNADGLRLKSRRQELEREAESIDGFLREASEIRRLLADVEHRLRMAEEAKNQRDQLKKKESSLKNMLASGDFAHDLRETLAEIEKQIKDLGYDAEAHKRMREELNCLVEFEALAAELKVAEENLAVDESNIRAISDLIETREKSIGESRLSMDQLYGRLREYESVESELQATSDSLRLLRASVEKLQQEIAVLEHLIERCDSLKVERKRKQEALDRAKRDRAIYGELVTAFGKKGVQALIIENAIPEIQEEANRLLARMTDNAMQVKLETVRNKKTGGVSETLDIKISDDMGTRSYELYSGGEAFRVNFALRIALSKLLARRAGARLQTLIIDEGFGTQDGKGREKLVEAIDSIKDDFEKILVITHIDELKDAFPTRIEITKDASGSQINVI